MRRPPALRASRSTGRREWLPKPAERFLCRKIFLDFRNISDIKSAIVTELGEPGRAACRVFSCAQYGKQVPFVLQPRACIRTLFQGLLFRCSCWNPVVLLIDIFFTSANFAATSCKPHCIFIVIYNERWTAAAKSTLGALRASHSSGCSWVRFDRLSMEERFNLSGSGFSSFGAPVCALRGKARSWQAQTIACVGNQRCCADFWRC
jgi:hypothetical protein